MSLKGDREYEDGLKRSFVTKWEQEQLGVYARRKYPWKSSNLGCFAFTKTKQKFWNDTLNIPKSLLYYVKCLNIENFNYNLIVWLYIICMERVVKIEFITLRKIGGRCWIETCEQRKTIKKKNSTKITNNVTSFSPQSLRSDEVRIVTLMTRAWTYFFKNFNWKRKQNWTHFCLWR